MPSYAELIFLLLVKEHYLDSKISNQFITMQVVLEMQSRKYNTTRYLI